MSIYIITEFFGGGSAPINEIKIATKTLRAAKDYCHRRWDVRRWKSHDAHGRWWESIDGDLKFKVCIVECEITDS